MIKAHGTRDGKPVLLLGLSRANVERLLTDQPIVIEAAELEAMGLPAVQVVILAGETEASIAGMLGAAPLQPEVPGQRFTLRPQQP